MTMNGLRDFLFHTLRRRRPGESNNRPLDVHWVVNIIMVCTELHNNKVID